VVVAVIVAIAVAAAGFGGVLAVLLRVRSGERLGQDLLVMVWGGRDSVFVAVVVIAARAMLVFVDVLMNASMIVIVVVFMAAVVIVIVIMAVLVDGPPRLSPHGNGPNGDQYQQYDAAQQHRQEELRVEDDAQAALPPEQDADGADGPTDGDGTELFQVIGVGVVTVVVAVAHEPFSRKQRLPTAAKPTGWTSRYSTRDSAACAGAGAS
jgi:hypothetical protein